MKLTVVPIAVALTLFATALLQPRTAAPTKLTSVQVFSDRLEPLPGATIRLTNRDASHVVTTDAEGQSPWVEFDPSQGGELVVTDMVAPAGIGLGFIERLVAPDLPDHGEDAHHWWISRTQPVAAPILVEGNPDSWTSVRPPEGDWPHWVVAVPGGSPLRFSCHVAPLLDREAVEQYAAYRGRDVRDRGYVRGVALVVPSVRLGDEGIVVGLSLLGDLQGADGVIVDAYDFFSGTGAVAPGPGVEVELLHVTNDVAYVRLTGAVRAGHLGLFARTSTAGPAEVFVVRDDPPEVAVPADGGRGDGQGPERDEGGATPPPTTECEPEVPDLGEYSCDPLAPAPNYCGAATPTGKRSCEVVRMRSPRYCKGPGSTLRTTQAEVSRWKVTFNLAGEVPSGTRKLKSGGGFEYGQEASTAVTDEWTAGEGEHGLGQCIRWFRFYLTCVQPYVVLVEDFVDGEIVPCERPSTVNTLCTDLTVSEATCSRTP